MIRTGFAPHFADDSESLQADVMRFMAIIAFCLVAILALVRNVTPVAEAAPAAPQLPPEPQAEQVREKLKKAEPEPIAGPASLVQPPPAVEPLPDLEPPPAAAPSPATPVAEPVVSLVKQKEKIVRVSRPPPAAVASAPDPVPSTSPPAPARPSTDASKEKGLSLRFASDSDFLRLIARGEITVFAFNTSDVLSLDEAYRFREAAAPGQVYELLLATIPSQVVDALRASRSDITPFSWGITLPSRIRGQIERHLETSRTGQLIIDRYGDVRHVP